MKKNRSKTKIKTLEADLIRALRHEKGISQRSLSERIPMSASTIAHLESGRMDLTSKRLWIILDYFGCTKETFEKYKSGALEVPENKLDRCLDAVRRLPHQKLSVALSILESL